MTDMPMRLVIQLRRGFLTFGGFVPPILKIPSIISIIEVRKSQKIAITMGCIALSERKLMDHMVS